jgi:Lamin Tail Domain
MLVSTTAAPTTKTIITTRTTRRRGGCLGGAVLQLLLSCCCYLLLSAQAPGASAALIITEFLAQNMASSTDEDGNVSDWLEIHNNATAAASLNGLYLTDNSTALTKWAFPTAATIPAGGYLIVWCSEKNRATAGAQLHTNFRLLARDGEYLALTDGTNVINAYAPQYPIQTADVSYGLDRNGNFGYFSTPTPGMANAAFADGFTAKGFTAKPSANDDAPQCWGSRIPIVGLFFHLICLIFKL